VLRHAAVALAALLAVLALACPRAEAACVRYTFTAPAGSVVVVNYTCDAQADFAGLPGTNPGDRGYAADTGAWMVRGPAAWAVVGGGGSPSWGAITGTLSNQADLQGALDGKLGAATKLDQLAAPTDVTTLNATTTAHGLLSKLPGGTTAFLREDGTWQTPAGGSATIASARVTADRTTTSATLAAVTDLAIAIGANETWSFEANINGGCDNTGGSQFSVDVPAGIVSMRAQFRGNTSTAAAASYSVSTVDNGASGTVWNAAAQNRQMRIAGVVVNGSTAGTIQVNFKSVTATQTTTVNANSYLTGRKH